MGKNKFKRADVTPLSGILRSGTGGRARWMRTLRARVGAVSDGCSCAYRGCVLA